MKRTIPLMAGILAAGVALGGVICAGDSAAVAIDSREEPIVESIDIAYDASWIGGDDGATVAISDNGVEVRRITGAGEFTHSLTETGRHELAYTTYIAGVTQSEVYRAVIFKDWKYEVVGDVATITDTALRSGVVSVPAEIDGYPVTGIAASTFSGCGGITSLTIPNSVKRIKSGAFSGCSSLASLVLPLRFRGIVSRMDIPGGCAISYAENISGTVLVSGLAAIQRRPWNGLVDISFTISGPESGYCIGVAATNAATGVEIPVRTLRDKAGNVIGKYTEFAPGAISLVWDVRADAPELMVETLTLSVVVAPPRGKIQLWEGGPCWAETNIGADEPWEYGLYFWWGDTIGGSASNFWYSKETLEKSLATLQSEGWVVLDDGTYVLSLEHDAAQAHWGEGWRMPTYQELDALNSNCDWTWTATNGVPGYVVRGRGDYADASIFLPAAGLNWGEVGDAGWCGYYWSSVPYSDDDNIWSWQLDFYSGEHNTDRYGGRCDGRSIRPVQGFAE